MTLTKQADMKLIQTETQILNTIRGYTSIRDLKANNAELADLPYSYLAAVCHRLVRMGMLVKCVDNAIVVFRKPRHDLGE